METKKSKMFTQVSATGSTGSTQGERVLSTPAPKARAIDKEELAISLYPKSWLIMRSVSG